LQKIGSKLDRSDLPKRKNIKRFSRRDWTDEPGTRIPLEVVCVLHSMAETVELAMRGREQGAEP